MTLFSTLIHFNCLLLFLYLGLICGITFGFLNRFFNALKRFLIKKKNNKIGKLNNNKDITSSLDSTKKNKPKNTKIKQNFYKGLITTFIFVFSSLSIIVFVGLMVFSFLVNLKYNFGVLLFWYCFIWAIFFYLGQVFVKIVANFFVNFYNYLKIKKEKPHEE